MMYTPYFLIYYICRRLKVAEYIVIYTYCIIRIANTLIGNYVSINTKPNIFHVSYTQTLCSIFECLNRHYINTKAYNRSTNITGEDWNTDLL